jgi:hypothetical protein
MSIQRDQFEAYAAIIKSGQMEQSEMPKFMEENPEFHDWYLSRRDAGDIFSGDH